MTPFPFSLYFTYTHKTLLEEQRKKTTLETIRKHDIPLEKLAEQLGYQDASSFSRAFKRWFGVAPNRFKGSQFDVDVFPDKVYQNSAFTARN